MTTEQNTPAQVWPVVQGGLSVPPTGLGAL